MANLLHSTALNTLRERGHPAGVQRRHRRAPRPLGRGRQPRGGAESFGGLGRTAGGIAEPRQDGDGVSGGAPESGCDCRLRDDSLRGAEFISAFDGTGQALCPPTILLIAISAFLSRFWRLIIPAALALRRMVLKWAQSPAGEREPGNLILRVPLAGPLVQRIQLGFFARTLGTLLERGVPIVATLSITADTLGNPQYREAVAGLAAIVRDGELLSRAIEGNPLFTSSLPSILAVGEHGGTLPETLGHAADEFDRDADRQVKVVMTLIEPLMIVLLGGVIGFIVLAMLLPIFNLGDSIQL